MADAEDLAAGMAKAMVESMAEPAPADTRSRLMAIFHRIAFVVLVAALVVAVVSPAWAARRPPQPDPGAALAATTPPPTPPPTPQALALLDAAIADGRLDAARSLIAPMWASGAPEVTLRAAELALASGSLPEAAEGFGSLTSGPLAGPAWQGLGITRLKQDRLAEAVTALDAAVAADAGLARAWNARAVIADRQRDWATADAAYAKAIAAQPGEAAWLANRGWSQLLRGHHVAAEQDLVAALALRPALGQARTNLALARAMQGRYQDAFRLSEKKTLAADLNTVGYAAMARGDLSVAEAYFNRALSLNPQFDRAAWANLQYLVALKGEGNRTR